MKFLLVQKMVYLPTLGGSNRANRTLIEGLAYKGLPVFVELVQGMSEVVQVFEDSWSRRYSVYKTWPQEALWPAGRSRPSGHRLRFSLSSAGIAGLEELETQSRDTRQARKGVRVP